MKENAKSYDDDYNYPSLGRKDLMSLSTLTNRDFPIRKINKINYLLLSHKIKQILKIQI